MQTAPTTSAVQNPALRRFLGCYEKIKAAGARRPLLLEITVLVLIILIGTAVRLEDLGQWYREPERAFVEGEPLHTTFDAWFYLSLAKDMVDGTYQPINEKRCIPDSPRRPSPPPLLSVIAATMSQLTGISLSWIGAILPAVLGPLLAIPVYLLGRFYGGHMMALSAALLVILYPYYVIRSSVGRFDTDCMIVTFCLAICYCFLCFGVEKTRRRYIFFLAGLVGYWLFLWWWDQVPAVVTAITLLCCAPALVFFYRPGKREGLVFVGLLGIMLGLYLVMQGMERLLTFATSLWGTYSYISHQSGLYPNVGVTISEQAQFPLAQLATSTSGSLPAFICGIAGIVLLFGQRFRQALLLAAPVFMAGLAFVYARRFAIFLVPILALGTGQVLALLWNLRKKYPAMTLLAPMVLLFLAGALYWGNKNYVQWPKESGPVASGMIAASRLTPPGAVIWAWWDHGYAINYLARRATINDGSSHSGERTLYNALPLVLDDFRCAANFMHFYVNRGMKGMNELRQAVDHNHTAAIRLLKEVLGQGPSEARSIISSANLKTVVGRDSVDAWIQFFFPGNTRPVYLFLDNRLLASAHWWFWLGTWDVEKQTGIHPLYLPFYNVRVDRDRITGDGGLVIDIPKGLMSFQQRRVPPLGHLTITTSKGFVEKTLHPKSPYHFAVHEPTRVAALMDAEIAASVFHKLFICHMFHKKYFRPIQLMPPAVYQLWEVQADTVGP